MDISYLARGSSSSSLCRVATRAWKERRGTRIICGQRLTGGSGRTGSSTSGHARRGDETDLSVATPELEHRLYGWRSEAALSAGPWQPATRRAARRLVGERETDMEPPLRGKSGNVVRRPRRHRHHLSSPPAEVVHGPCRHRSGSRESPPTIGAILPLRPARGERAPVARA